MRSNHSSFSATSRFFSALDPSLAVNEHSNLIFEIVGLVILLEKKTANCPTSFTLFYQAIHQHLDSKLADHFRFSLDQSVMEHFFSSILDALALIDLKEAESTQAFLVALFQFLDERKYRCEFYLGLPKGVLTLALKLSSCSPKQTVIESDYMPHPDDLKKINTGICFYSTNKQITFLMRLFAEIFSFSVQWIKKEEKKGFNLIKLPSYGRVHKKEKNYTLIEKWHPRYKQESCIYSFLANRTPDSLGIFLTHSHFLIEESNHALKLREYLIKHRLAHTVIHLPKSIFPAFFCKFSLLLIQPQTEQQLHFINAQEQYIEQEKNLNLLNLPAIVEEIDSLKLPNKTHSTTAFTIPYANVKKLYFSFCSWHHYPLKNDNLPANHKIVYLCDLLIEVPKKPLREGVQYKKVDDSSFYGHLRIEKQNFSEEHKWSKEDTAKLSSSYKEIDEPCLLIKEIGVDFKIAYFEPEKNQAIAVFIDVFCFKLKKGKNLPPEYLLLKLSDSEVSRKLFLSTIIELELRSKAKDFLRLALVLLDFDANPNKALELAESAIAQAKRDRFQALIKEQGLNDQIEELKQQLLKKNNSQMHTLGNIIFQMRSTLKCLVRNLSDNNLNLPAAQKRAEKLSKNLNDIAALFKKNDSSSDLSKSMEKVDLLQFIKDWKKSLEWPNTKINIIDLTSQYHHFKDNEKTIIEVKILKQQFKHDVLNNIWNNAITHGFTKKGKSYEFRIEICLIKEKGRNYCLLSFKNNGNPLAKGINQDSYCARTLSAGKNANSGIGGADVFEAVKSMNGLFKLDTKGDAEFPFSIKIYLPLND